MRIPNGCMSFLFVVVLVHRSFDSRLAAGCPVYQELMICLPLSHTLRSLVTRFVTLLW
jgi:hypothetical protein